MIGHSFGTKGVVVPDAICLVFGRSLKGRHRCDEVLSDRRPKSDDRAVITGPTQSLETAAVSFVGHSGRSEE